MLKVTCINCSTEDSESLLIMLPENHKEFYLARLTNDGTKKWYLCPKCEGVFCRDKVLGIWQLSPGTYTEFVKRGIIEDRLQND